jgi:hypothetical protein
LAPSTCTIATSASVSLILSWIHSCMSNADILGLLGSKEHTIVFCLSHIFPNSLLHVRRNLTLLGICLLRYNTTTRPHAKHSRHSAPHNRTSPRLERD